jgi:anti-sigma B factor antagonist
MPEIEEPAKLGSTEFSVRQHSDAHGVVLALAGELDLSSAPELERALEEAGALPVKRLILDLAELSFMDSTGVSVLVRTKQRADGGGRILAVRSPNGQVRRLLELVGLLDRLEVEE